MPGIGGSERGGEWTLMVGTINEPLLSPTFFTFPSFLPVIPSNHPIPNPTKETSK